MFCSLQFLHGLCVEDEEEITGLRKAEKEQKERTKNLAKVIFVEKLLRNYQYLISWTCPVVYAWRFQKILIADNR